MTASETKSSELKRDFNIAMAEKVIKRLSFFGAAQNSSRQLQNEIKSRSKSDFSDCLYFLEKYGMIGRNKEKRRRGQKITVTLTDTGELILKFGIVRIFLAYMHKENEKNHKQSFNSIPYGKAGGDEDSSEQRRLKAIHFFLARGEFGVSYPKIIDIRETKIEPGYVRLDEFHFWSVDRHEEGISVEDLVEQRDISCSGIFAYLSVTKEEAEELKNFLVDEGVMKEIGKEGREIRYGIADNALKLYIKDYLGLHQTRLSVMGRLLSTIRGIRRGARQDFDIVNYFEGNMGSDANHHIQKLENVRGGLSAGARATYKNEFDIYVAQIKWYQNQIHGRRKMYEKLEEKYPVITTVLKMFVTSDIFGVSGLIKDVYRN